MITLKFYKKIEVVIEYSDSVVSSASGVPARSIYRSSHNNV